MKKSIAILLVLILLFSLTACKKEEPIPSAPESSSAPEASEEVKEEEPLVKEFSDGRLYADGNIISFAETENYYFTLDNHNGEKYISCYTKDGQLLKRDKPYGYKDGKQVVFYPETDIYPIKNDCIVYGCSDVNNRYIRVDSQIKTHVMSNSNFPDLRYFQAAFLDNGEGYYDILTLNYDGLLYRFNEDGLTTFHEWEQFNFSDLSPYHYSEPRSAFRTEDGNIYIYGSIADPFYDEYFQDKVVLAKFSDSGEMLASKICSFGYESIIDAQAVGDYIVFAQAAFELSDATYTNRLFVLDKNLNEVFTKDYTGEIPVEVLAIGDNLAVNIYIHNGDRFSYVQVLNNYGETVSDIFPNLLFPRLLSDNNGGFYITGKQGENFKSPVDTVARRYNENLELVNESVYNTREDEDNGFGMFIEINNAGLPVALQSNIVNFPIRIQDKSPKKNAYYNYENSFDTETVPEQPVKLNSPAPPAGTPITTERDIVDDLTAENKHYVLVGDDFTPERYLYCYSSNGEGLWKVKVQVGGQLYYVNGCIMAHRGDILEAYDPDTGENLWSMHLEWTTSTVSAVTHNDKLYIIRNLENEYSVCIIDSEGNWEYRPMTIPSFGLPESLLADKVTDELYCIFRKDDIITLGRLNENFEVVAHHTVGDFNNMSYTYAINNGAVYVYERSKLEELTDVPYCLKVFDSELNLINTLEYDYYFTLLGGVGNLGYGIKGEVTEGNTQGENREQTFILDNKGNTVKALTLTGEAIRIFTTDSGVSVMVKLNSDDYTYKVYDYDENLMVENISFYTKTTNDFIEYFVHNGTLLAE